ncbi:GPRDIH1 [Trypoxylus dichotomus]
MFEFSLFSNFAIKNLDQCRKYKIAPAFLFRRYNRKYLDNATRFCLPNGTWDQYTDYTNCTELLLEGTEVELTTTIYFVGYAISLVGLIVAVYIFWRFK